MMKLQAVMKLQAIMTFQAVISLQIASSGRSDKQSSTSEKSNQSKEHMVKIVFTQNLQHHIDQPPLEFDAAAIEGGVAVDPPTVGEILASIFAANPRLAHYCVDDQGVPRNHIAIFVGGKPLLDRQGLSDRVASDDEIYVMQALSGG